MITLQRWILLPLSTECEFWCLLLIPRSDNVDDWEMHCCFVFVFRSWLIVLHLSLRLGNVLRLDLNCSTFLPFFGELLHFQLAALASSLIGFIFKLAVFTSSTCDDKFFSEFRAILVPATEGYIFSCLNVP